MDVLEEFLSAKEREAQFPPINGAAEARLLKFDDWLYSKLAERIDWRWAGDDTDQTRRINQARNYVERLVIALWRRGWLLDGKELAKHILAPIDAVADYQKRGRIKEFWPYFCATVDRYVGLNSEEIQIEAKRIGATMGQLVGTLGLKPKTEPTLPELITQRAIEVVKANEGKTLRERQSALRAEVAKKEKAERQPELF